MAGSNFDNYGRSDYTVPREGEMAFKSFISCKKCGHLELGGVGNTAVVDAACSACGAQMQFNASSTKRSEWKRKAKS